MEPIFLFQAITSLASTNSDWVTALKRTSKIALIIINSPKFLESDGLNIALKLLILRSCRKRNAAQKDFGFPYCKCIGVSLKDIF